LYIERRRRVEAPAIESRIAASLAHEINNPLDSILNLLYMVRSDVLSERARQYLDLASEEVRRVGELAKTAMSRTRAPVATEEVDVPLLMDSVIDVYKPRFVERGIELSTRYNASNSLPVFSGPLRQVFSNLLLNAADSMPRGGRLHARASACREWSGQQRDGVRVTVADTGCGIAKEKLREIFEPYYSTKGLDGRGLGLSLVKDVVQWHDGSLRVRSSRKPGRSGSVFVIFLPCKKLKTTERVA